MSSTRVNRATMIRISLGRLSDLTWKVEEKALAISLRTWGFLLKDIIQKGNPKKLGENTNSFSLKAYPGPSVPSLPPVHDTRAR